LKIYAYGTRAARRLRVALPALGLLVLASLLALTLARASGAAAVAVPLGSADSFAILAGAGITNTGATTVSGDIGTFPTTSETGFGTLTQSGANHAGDAVTQNAKNDLVTAYNNAAAQGPTTPIVGLTLGGKTLVRGVYNSGSTIDLTGTVTLDGQGDPDSVFVIQAGSALTTATSSTVALINGARSCNVFWQIGSDATLGVGSTFVGTLLVQNAIVVDTGAVITGRLLASVASVTLDTNTINKPGCTSGAGSSSSPDRTLYCKGGTAYNLIVGQDKVAPYAALNLTPGFIDPVTGVLTCTASTPSTTTATTTTAATTTTSTTSTTATTPTATPTGPTAKQIAAAKAKRLAAVKAKRIALAKARSIAAAKAIKKTPKPTPWAAVTTTFGFTG
jgi:hypothetical protein